MRDPIGLLIVLLQIGYGSTALLFPQWYYRAITPEQAIRDRKRTRIFGAIALLLGLILLIIRFWL